MEYGTEASRELMEQEDWELGMSAMRAILDQRVDLLVAALDEGCDPDFAKGSYTLLHAAAQERESHLFIAPLLEAGASCAPVAGAGSALMAASLAGNLASVEMLLRHGAQANAPSFDAMDGYRQPALSLAAGMGRLGVVRALVEAGAEMDLLDATGSTALRRAVEHGQGECAALLVRLGADPDLQGFDGQTAPMWAAASKWPHALLAMSAMLERGFDWNMEDAEGRSAIDYAKANPDWPAAKALLGSVDAMELAKALELHCPPPEPGQGAKGPKPRI